MNTVEKSSSIAALNYHVWQPCNMKCAYCFAEFKDVVPQLREDKAMLKGRSLAVVYAAANAGIQKITFVGGEPTLCPWLTELIELSKRLGMVTMVVTNGSRIDDAWIDKNARWLDWAAISVDSLNQTTNIAIGRSAGSSCAPDAHHYLQLFTRLSSKGIKIKVNTVVSSLNWEENFTRFLLDVQPKRWKVLQALHIHGENDMAFPRLATTPEQFTAFVERHYEVSTQLMLAAEDNDSMIGSYLMVDPLGRFFTNIGNVQRYSQPIWQSGWDAARVQVEVSTRKFFARGGLYSW